MVVCDNVTDVLHLFSVASENENHKRQLSLSTVKFVAIVGSIAYYIINLYVVVAINLKRGGNLLFITIATAIEL